MLPAYQKLLDVDRMKNVYYITVKSSLNPKKKLVQEIVRVEHLGPIDPERDYLADCEGYWGRLMEWSVLWESGWLAPFLSSLLKDNLHLYPDFPEGIDHTNVTELSYMTYVKRAK